MKWIAICALAFAALMSGSRIKDDPVTAAVQKGVQWLVSTQGKDGGWGQDGGETSYVRQGERLESNGNDVANTAVAATALLHAGSTPTHGEYQASLLRAVDFILRHVEESPAEGLQITNLNGTQIQRKLGPCIDTFLTSKLLAELDGEMGNARANARVRQALQKCIAKIQKNQLKDGSWNVAGGWAPILGTSMASHSLYVAKQKGVAVSNDSMAKVQDYTAKSSQSYAASAGVPLYQDAQALEQLSRTEKDRRDNARQIKAMADKLASPQYVLGFGSFGGEEFFSYLNISDSLHRAGGEEWQKWNSDIKAKLLKLQNEDGTWAGHHCITGRVAVTSAAILVMLVDREKTN